MRRSALPYMSIKASRWGECGIDTLDPGERTCRATGEALDSSTGPICRIRGTPLDIPPETVEESQGIEQMSFDTRYSSAGSSIDVKT
jgi:hypothetical protein